MADAIAAQGWRGSNEESSDYDRACQIFNKIPEPPGGIINVGDIPVLIWDTEGAGTGDVFINGENQVMILRAWLDEAETSSELGIISAIAELPMNYTVSIGQIEIISGTLAILWAPESGEGVQILDTPETNQSSGNVVIDNGGILIKMPFGNYSCYHDTVELNQSSARRCYLTLC